jgi:site-specific DNA-methyltransferase (adenine-specific)
MNLTSTFQNEKTKIILGDAITVLNEYIKDESIDLIFVDPPYNIGKKFADFQDKWEDEENYILWCYQWLDLCVNKLKKNGSIYVMSSTQTMPYIDLYLRKKLTILSRIVWYYDSSGVQAKKYYGSLYEPILFCVKDKNNYIFNADDILVEAKTGSQRNF